MTDVIAVYCQEILNGGGAVRRYIALNLNRRQPNRKPFQRLKEHGSFRPKCYIGRPVATNIEVEEDIQEILKENSEIGVRRLSPYHQMTVQELLPNDLVLRRDLCQWLRVQTLFIMRPKHFHYEFSIYIWCDVIGNYLLGFLHSQTF